MDKEIWLFGSDEEVADYNKELLDTSYVNIYTVDRMQMVMALSLSRSSSVNRWTKEPAQQSICQLGGTSDN